MGLRNRHRQIVCPHVAIFRCVSLASCHASSLPLPPPLRLAARVLPAQALAFPRPLPKSTLAAYLYTGGLAGYDDLLTITSDGRATVDSGTYRPRRVKITIGPRELTLLRRQIRAAHLGRVKSQPPNGCCDQIDVWIYGAGRTVRNPKLTASSALGRLDAHLHAILDRGASPRP